MPARTAFGDHASALVDWDRAVKIDPRLPMAFINRGHVLAALGDRYAAARSFRDAIELDPAPDVHDEALEGLVALGASADEEDHESDDEDDQS